MTQASDRGLGFKKKLLFSLVPVTLLLLLAEGALRVTGAAEHCGKKMSGTIYVCDPLLHFRLRPDLEPNGKPLNTQGFRDDEFTEKAPGVFRVLSLGDSTTFGVLFRDGLRYVPEPYPQVLERLASERRLGDVTIEVLNAGIPGYNTYHGLMMLRTRLRGLEPDVITVRYGWNDAFGGGAGAYQDPSGPIARVFFPWLVRTHLYRFGRRVRLDLAPHNEFGVPQLSVATQAGPAVPVEQFRENLARIVDVGRSLGAEVWLLTEPDAFVAGPNAERVAKEAGGALAEPGVQKFLKGLTRIRDERVRYNDAVEEVARTTGAPLVDMVARYQAYQDDGTKRRRLFGASDYIHPLPAGHLLEGEALFQELRTRHFSQASP